MLITSPHHQHYVIFFRAMANAHHYHFHHHWYFHHYSWGFTPSSLLDRIVSLNVLLSNSPLEAICWFWWLSWSWSWPAFTYSFPPIHHDPPTILVTDVSSTGFSHYSSTQLDNSHSQSISPGSGSVLRTSIKYKISLKIMMLTILVLPSTKNVDSKINVNTWKVLSVQSLSIMKAEERARCIIFSSTSCYRSSSSSWA